MVKDRMTSVEAEEHKWIVWGHTASLTQDWIEPPSPDPQATSGLSSTSWGRRWTALQWPKPATASSWKWDRWRSHAHSFNCLQLCSPSLSGAESLRQRPSRLQGLTSLPSGGKVLLTPAQHHSHVGGGVGPDSPKLSSRSHSKQLSGLYALREQSITGTSLLFNRQRMFLVEPKDQGCSSEFSW